MKRLLLVGMVLVAGCSRQQQKQADPAFDARWQQATAAAEPAYIESQRGGGLLGEVRRAVDPPAPGSAAEVVQGPLPDLVVAGVIKRNLPAVKGCYEVEERAGTVGSGKAIVTIDIDPAGTVQHVSVDAPAFAASNLPACLSARAKAWTFPKATQGPKKFSYPFVFVGG
jgi:hypothetical protein